MLGVRRFAAGLVAAVALFGAGALKAPPASADATPNVVLEIGITCSTTGTNTAYTYFYGFTAGDTIKFVDRSGSGAGRGCRWKGNNTDGTVTPSDPNSPGPWFFTPQEGSGSWIYFVDSSDPIPQNSNPRWTAEFQVLPPSGSSAAGPGVAAPVNYTVDLDPEDGGTCTVAKVTGPAGSWQRLPQADACSKPGYRFVAWEARDTGGPPTMTYPANSFINLTGNNRLYAVWAPVDAPVAEPVTATRWVVWRWDANARQLRPVSADLVGLKPVVTIHAPRAGAVSNDMVEAAKALAAKNGGAYNGIVTSTKWSKPRIITAYKR